MIRALTGYSTRHPWKVIALWAVLGVVLSALAPTLIARVTQHRTGNFGCRCVLRAMAGRASWECSWEGETLG